MPLRFSFSERFEDEMIHYFGKRKEEDPRKTKLRAERERANLWLQVLLNGIGKTMQDEYRSEAEYARPIVDIVNGPFVDAIKASEAAEKAYEPYWRRRIYRYRPKRLAKAAKKK